MIDDHDQIRRKIILHQDTNQYDDKSDRHQTATSADLINNSLVNRISNQINPMNSFTFFVFRCVVKKKNRFLIEFSLLSISFFSCSSIELTFQKINVDLLLRLLFFRIAMKVIFIC